MKILSLNTWGGRPHKEAQLDFFKNQSDIDIFCLQEIWGDPYESHVSKKTGGVVINRSEIWTTGLDDLSSLFSNHASLFHPHFGDKYGLLMFVNKKFEILDSGELFVYKEKGWTHEEDGGNHARNIQWAKLKTTQGTRVVINFHGLWNGQGKGDSEDRLRQSENIINFIKSQSDPVIFCGDFNLRPDTESIKKFEDFGLRNLIKEYGITSTRTSFYTKPEKFADYAISMADVIPEFGIIRENEERRDGGCGVVYDPVAKKFAIGLEENGRLRLFSGGVDAHEDIQKGVLREVEEESGLYDFGHIEKLTEAFAHFRNNLKNINRIAHATCFLIVLNSTRLKPAKLEAHEKFCLTWATSEEIHSNWQIRNENKDHDHWIYFMKKAESRLKELGYD